MLLWFVLACGPQSELESPEMCSDQLDNDNDGLADCFDSDCLSAHKCPETAYGEQACADIKDNDQDGQIDCADQDCSAVLETLLRFGQGRQ